MSVFRNVFPAPAKAEATGGKVTFAPGTPAVTPHADDLLRYLFGDAFALPAAGHCDLCVTRRDTLPTGAYTVEIGDGILLSGSGYEGVAHALETLRQLASFEADGSVTFPRCVIEDAPYMPVRGVHFYLPPANLIDGFLDILGELAALKYNVIFLEIGGGLEYDRHPEINAAWRSFCREAREYPGGPQGLQASEPYWKDSTHVELAGSSCITKAQLRRIADHCRMLGIEIIPEIQGLSHAYYLTLAHPEIAERPFERWPDSWCPSCDESYELYFDVADEILGVLHPRRVSIGHDEVRILGECPRCRGKSGAELLAADLNRLHDFYARRGIEVWMWGEKLQYFRNWKGVMTGGEAIPERTDRYGRRYSMPATWQAADMVPKDLVMLDWYHSQASDTEVGFLRKGFREIFGNFHGMLIADWEVRSRRANVLGAEFSCWCVPDEYEMGYNGWFPEIVFTAAVLWRSDYTEARRAEFDEETMAYLPALRGRIGGTGAFDGSLASLNSLSSPDGNPFVYRGGTIAPDTAAALSDGEIGPDGVDTDIRGDSIVLFHAAVDTDKVRRTTTWNFLDKGLRIPARYALTYDDGLTVTVAAELGVTVGPLSSTAEFVRPSAAAARNDDIDDDRKGSDVSLAPLWERKDKWRNALTYFCRYADVTLPDGTDGTVWAFELPSPHPGHRVTHVHVVDEPGCPAAAKLFAVAGATRK